MDNATVSANSAMVFEDPLTRTCYYQCCYPALAKAGYCHSAINRTSDDPIIDPLVMYMIVIIIDECLRWPNFRSLARLFGHIFVILIRIALFLFIDVPKGIRRLHRGRNRGGLVPLRLRDVDLKCDESVAAYWDRYAPQFAELAVPEHPDDKEVEAVMSKRYKSYIVAQQLRLGPTQRVAMTHQRNKSC